MSGKTKNADKLEVSSDQLKSELIEIKERLGALETIASISNRKEVEAYVRGCLKTAKGKLIMKECEEPQTREHLISKFSFATPQALDYHLTPLRRDDLLQHHVDDDGTQTFEWSNLFKRLPKKTLGQILDGSD
jgi:hypothetical protein